MMEKEKNEGIIRTERRSRDGWEYTYILSVSLSRMTASYSLPLYSVSVELSHSTMGKTKEILKDAFSDIGKAMEFDRIFAENKAKKDAKNQEGPTQKEQIRK